MQRLTPIFRPPPARSRRARGWLAAATTLAALVAGVGEARAATCPWIVQPVPAAGQGAGAELAYDITFDGIGQQVHRFYAFSVTSVDLAWQIADQVSLPDLGDGGRPLERVETSPGTAAYRPAPESIEPPTIYLVAARRPVPELEAIDARIEPARPVAISQLALRTRGGSDQSGALPHRSLPGFLIAEAGAEQPGPALQICAYEVGLG